MNKSKRIVKAVKRIFFLFLCLMICVVIVLGVAVGVSHLQNQSFKETFYEVTCNKVDGDLRIIQISDLHAAQYSNLLQRVQILKPDIIVLTGDLLDWCADEAAVAAVAELGGGLVQIAPTYYVYGNHERMRQFGSDLMKEDIKKLAQANGFQEDEIDFSAIPDPLREQMEAAGVNVLHNEQVTLQIGRTTVDIYGILTASSFSSFYGYAENGFYQYTYADQDNFKLLLTHEPYLMEWITCEDWGDLILCGHTHGGIARLPYFGGMYENLYGFLPEFLNDGRIQGRYDAQGTPMIVSAGLDNQDVWRINNQPELVVVDINHF